MPYKDPEKQKACKKIWEKKFGLEKSRKRRLRHKIVLERIKSEIGCEHCDYRDPIVLQFHHINPKDKSFTISKISRTLIDILRETEKCMVLCANCHIKEEHRLNDNSLY